LISTALLITLFPFITNDAFFLHIKFNKWKLDQKNALEMNTLLTLEQSIQLREDLLKAEERMEGFLERKNQEIKELTMKVAQLSAANPPLKNESVEMGQRKDQSDDDLVDQLATKINNSDELKKSFDVTVMYIQGGYSNLLGADNVTSKAIAYFESNNIIKSAGEGKYVFTDIGREILKKSLEKSFAS
jgi:predicted nuclease with TOPRIM domain